MYVCLCDVVNIDQLIESQHLKYQVTAITDQNDGFLKFPISTIFSYRFRANLNIKHTLFLKCSLVKIC